MRAGWYKVLVFILVLSCAFAAFAEAWTCPDCGIADNTGNFCSQCGAAKPRDGVWICDSCGSENDTNFCTNCGAPRAEQSDAPSSASYSKGDLVTFGTYEQDNDKGNGAEPIEWIVYDIADDGTCLLLSVYGLDCQPYNKKDGDYTWEQCSLRAWLNDDFYNAAFADDEKAKIQLWDVANKYGNDTQDYVFLLTRQEVQEQFMDDETMWCPITKYTAKRGVNADKSVASRKYPDGVCENWHTRNGYYIDVYGCSTDLGTYVSMGGIAVRPVIAVRF